MFSFTGLLITGSASCMILTGCQERERERSVYYSCVINYCTLLNNVVNLLELVCLISNHINLFKSSINKTFDRHIFHFVQKISTLTDMLTGKKIL